MKLIYLFLFSFFLLLDILCFSQPIDEKPAKKKTKFQAGLYMGSYFANKYTTTLYDGYGYDIDGMKNDYFNSFMYRKIILEYGGGYGQADQVALALGVNHGEWAFDETDMPQNMKYNPAFMIGVNLSYAATKTDAFLLNVNAAKFTASGNFTIVITTPPIGPQQPGYQNIQAFGISGIEQRFMFQAGYRKILGEDEVFNFFIEGGPTLNMTKYLRNYIAINTLHIDISTYYSQTYYPTYRAKYLNGMGLGAFAGLGLNITANTNWSIQVAYSPSYEKINIGEEPKNTLQHSMGLRAYYNL